MGLSGEIPIGRMHMLCRGLTTGLNPRLTAHLLHTASTRKAAYVSRATEIESDPLAKRLNPPLGPPTQIPQAIGMGHKVQQFAWRPIWLEDPLSNAASDLLLSQTYTALSRPARRPAPHRVLSGIFVRADHSKLPRLLRPHLLRIGPLNKTRGRRNYP